MLFPIKSSGVGKIDTQAWPWIQRFTARIRSIVTLKARQNLHSPNSVQHRRNSEIDLHPKN